MYTTKKVKDGWIVVSPQGQQAFIPQPTRQAAEDIAVLFNLIMKEG